MLFSGMAKIEHDRWSVVTDRDGIVGASGPDGFVHGTRLEGAMKTASEWRVTLHYEGDPVHNEERIQVPIDTDIWEWMDERLDEVQAAAEA